MKILDTIQGVPIYLHDDGHVSFLADADIDADGAGGNVDNDPDFQPDTTLHHTDGTALNAQTEAFIVVPGGLAHKVGPIVMGCQARVHYRQTGAITEAVVGDVGPSRKVGELSVKCAKMLAMPPSPINGGEDRMDQVLYEFFPGVPAVVAGILYPLQAS